MLAKLKNILKFMPCTSADVASGSHNTALYKSGISGIRATSAIPLACGIGCDALQGQTKGTVSEKQFIAQLMYMVLALKAYHSGEIVPACDAAAYDWLLALQACAPFGL